MPKFQGLISVPSTREETYEKREKGKMVTKTKTVPFTSERVVSITQKDEARALKDLNSFARMCKGKVEWVKAV